MLRPQNAGCKVPPFPHHSLFSLLTVLTCKQKVFDFRPMSCLVNALLFDYYVLIVVVPSFQCISSSNISHTQFVFLFTP